MQLKNLIIAFFLFWGYEAVAQNELSFYQYLIDSKHLTEANFYTNELAKNQNINKDSLLWLRAKLNYNLKNYDTAAYYLEKIKNPVFYPENLFAASLYRALSKQKEKALEDLNLIKTNDSSVLKLQVFQRANLFLLMRQTDEYKQNIEKCDTNFYVTHNSIVKVKAIAEDIDRHKPKSPALAAMFSAVIPGSGKYYAGRTGEAFSALLSVGFLSAMAIENYRHYGINHGRTYMTVGLAGIFYIGNIWGSYYSVKRTKNVFNEKVDNNLLYHQQYTYDSFFQ